MKKSIFTFALFLASFTSLLAQEFAGKRIVSGNLSMLLAGSTSTPNLNMSNLVLNVSFLTGKIKANNTYTAYGFNFGNVSFTSPSSGSIPKNFTDTRYTVGPVVQVGKFVKVFDQFYFAPNTTFNVSGIFGSTESPSSTGTVGGFGFGLNVSPLNFVYQVKENFLLSMAVGQIGFSYNNQTTTVNNVDFRSYALSANGNITNFSSLGAYYLF